MTDLGKRYHKVLKNELILEKLHSNESERFHAFEDAKCYLKDNIDLYWIDSNLCTLIDNGRGKILSPLTKKCFVKSLTAKERQKKYTALKRFFQAQQTKWEINMGVAKPPKVYINYQTGFAYAPPNAQLKIVSRDIPYVYKKCVRPLSTYINPTTDEITMFLYRLTDGDINCLMELAKLCACILSEPLAIRKPIVILADQAVHSTIEKFLHMVANNRIAQLPLKKVIHNAGLAALHAYNLAGYFVNLLINDTIPESELEIKKLTDIMAGKKFSINDPHLLGKANLKNSIPFVYITDSHEKYLMMRNIYGAKAIKIPLKNDIPVPTDVYSSMWFQEEFALWGLQCLSDKTPKDVYVSKIKEDDVFRSFVNDVCIVAEDLNCPKATLYDAYQAYFKKYYGDEPLSKIMFGKKFAIFGNLETTRPHKSRKNYLYCFNGIAVNENKLKKIMETEENSRYCTSYEEFSKRLCESTTHISKYSRVF